MDQVQSPTPASPTPLTTNQISVDTQKQTNGSKALAASSLVLAITAFLTGFLFFIAAPLAVTAVILAIAAIVKQRPGKRMAIVSLVVAGITLLLLPIMADILLIGFNSVIERTNQ